MFVCCEFLWYLSTGLFQPELGGMQSKSCLINSNPILFLYQTFNLRWRMTKTNTISLQIFHKLDGNPYGQQQKSIFSLCWLAQTLLSGSEQMHWIRKWKWSISLESAKFQFPSPHWMFPIVHWGGVGCMLAALSTVGAKSNTERKSTRTKSYQDLDLQELEVAWI